MKQITKVSLELALDQLTPMHRSSFTFPKETQFLGAQLIDNSKLNIFYMAPEKNFEKTGDYEGYDFIILSLNYKAFTIPDEFEFITTFPWNATTYGVFFRKCQS